MNKNNICHCGNTTVDDNVLVILLCFVNLGIPFDSNAVGNICKTVDSNNVQEEYIN